MTRFIDTRGHSNLAVGVCGRCGTKMPLDELMPDGNVPGLMVCQEDRDEIDPWRLAPRAAERITVDNPRPDVPVDTQGPTSYYTNLISGIANIGPALPWQASSAYAVGNSITPLSVDADTTTLPQYWFVCVTAGNSGAVATVWPTRAGVRITDGTVTWLCLGIFPN